MVRGNILQQTWMAPSKVQIMMIGEYIPINVDDVKVPIDCEAGVIHSNEHG